MAGPKKIGKRRGTADLVPRKGVSEDWTTYRSFLTELQIEPKFQRGFFDEVVYPYRQKAPQKVLLQRGTEKSIDMLTEHLVRGYGKRVWGVKSHWLVGPVRTGAPKPKPVEGHKDVKGHEGDEGMWVQEDMKEQGDAEVKFPTEVNNDNGENSDEDEQYEHATSCIGASTHVSVGLSHEDGSPGYNGQDKDHEDAVNEGDIEVGTKEKTVKAGRKIKVADLYIDDPQDKARIENILNAFFVYMRFILFVDRSAQDLDAVPAIVAPYLVHEDKITEDRMSSKSGGETGEMSTGEISTTQAGDAQPVSDQEHSESMDDWIDEEAGEDCEEDSKPSHRRKSKSQDPNRRHRVRMARSNQYPPRLSVELEHISQEKYDEFLRIVQPILGIRWVDTTEEPVEMAPALANDVELANDAYHGHPIYNPFKDIIQMACPAVKYEAELLRHSVSHRTGVPYTWSEIAMKVLPTEAKNLYQLRIANIGSRVTWPCDPQGHITDIAACAVATARYRSEGKLTKNQRIVCFHLDQYGNMSYTREGVVDIKVEMPVKDEAFYKFMLEHLGYKFLKNGVVVEPAVVRQAD